MKYAKFANARGVKQANNLSKYINLWIKLNAVNPRFKINDKEDFWVDGFHGYVGESFSSTNRKNRFKVDNGYVSNYGDYIKAKKYKNKIFVLEGEHKWKTFKIS